MSAGETGALLSGASPPTATTEGPTPGMDIKGDSFIGSPVATASSSPPPVSRAWAPLWQNSLGPGECPVQVKLLLGFLLECS